MLPARSDYQRWVAAVFNGRGRGIRQILVRSGGLTQRASNRWCIERGVPPRGPSYHVDPDVRFGALVCEFSVESVNGEVHERLDLRMNLGTVHRLVVGG